MTAVVVGVGVDVVDVARFAASVQRTPALAGRILTAAEREGRRTESLAARFAAKEALAKALGAPGGMDWQDAEVEVAPSGQPVLRMRGTVAARGASLGVTRAHLSLSHDGGTAVAFVVLV